DLDEAGTVDAAKAVTDLLESLTRTYLRRGEGSDIAASVARDGPAFGEIELSMPDLGTPQQRRRLARHAEALVDGGADYGSAQRWAATAYLTLAPDIAQLARETARDVTGVAQAFLQLSDALGIDRLLDQLAGLRGLNAAASMTLADRWSH